MAEVRPELEAALQELESGIDDLLDYLADEEAIPNAPELRDAIAKGMDVPTTLCVAGYLLRQSRRTIEIMHRDMGAAITIGQEAFTHYQLAQTAPARAGKRKQGETTRERFRRLLAQDPDITAEQAAERVRPKTGTRTAERHLAAIRKGE